MVSVESIGSYMLSVLIMVLSIIMGGAVLIGGFFLYQKWKQYKEYNVIIWQLNGFGQPEISHDRGGVYVDKKTNAKRLFLKKNKVDLSADRIPYLPDGKRKVVYLRKYGLKNFRYVEPVITNEGISFQVGEEDVNWALNSFERGKKAFSLDKLMQYLPYIALGFVSIIVLIIMIYLIRQFDVLKDISAQLVEAAKIIAQAKSGTTVIQ